MGWLFSERWLKRKDLIEHLVENKGGAKVIKHCCVGNNLWLVMETERRPGVTIRFVVLCMMQGPHNSGKGYTGSDKDWWGYKDVDEGMGPYQMSCPESYLTMCTAPENAYAYEWRQRIYARHRKLRAAVVGAKYLDRDGSAVEITKRRGPSSWLITVNGYHYKAGPQYINSLEEVTCSRLLSKPSAPGTALASTSASSGESTAAPSST